MFLEALIFILTRRFFLFQYRIIFLKLFYFKITKDFKGLRNFLTFTFVFGKYEAVC